jgi:hypothetical protein
MAAISKHWRTRNLRRDRTSDGIDDPERIGEHFIFTSNGGDDRIHLSGALCQPFLKPSWKIENINNRLDNQKG